MGRIYILSATKTEHIFETWVHVTKFVLDLFPARALLKSLFDWKVESAKSKKIFHREELLFEIITLFCVCTRFLGQIAVKWTPS